MPGGKPRNIYEGDKGEFLAQYLLSFIGLPLPVLRQVDIGIDFYCNISDDSQKLMTFSHPFSIQIKKLNEDTNQLSERISYGGLTKKGKWKKYEIEWLFNPAVPFFVGVLDSKNRTLFIYSTSAMWFSYHDQNLPTMITLIPRINSESGDLVHQPKKEQMKIMAGKIDCGDSHEHKVDLGDPIIEINIDVINDKENIKQIKIHLGNFIEKVEARNIIQRNLKSSFFWWNKDLINGQLAWHENHWSPNFDVNKCKEELVPIIVPMALHFKETGQKTDFDQLKGVLQIIYDFIPEEIKTLLSKQERGA